MAKNLGHQNHVAAGFHKRRANASAALMRETSGMVVTAPPPALRPSLDQAFNYAEFDAESAAELQTAANRIRERMRQTIENVISIGGELTVVQAKLAKHNGGTFQAWCRLEFGWSKASAYNFINVFNQFGSRPNIGQLDAGLSALYMLAAPGVPDEARDEAIARAEQGERITAPAAATIIQSFRPPAPSSPVAPMADEEWAQLADRGEGGIEYVDPDDSPEGAQPAPYRPPQPPPMTTITVPAHGIQVGMWLTDPGQGGKWKIVGLTGTRANLQNAISSNIAEFPIEWVATWQRTDAPAPQPPRPFVTSSQPSGALTIPPQPPQPPRALTSGMTSSESEEWYTPAWLIEKVRDCLDGNIDLDPASSELANTVVQAARYYTIEQDSISLPWDAGALFLNPPYGDELLPFMRKLVDEHSAGHFQRALVLVPARTETRWFYLLRHHPRVFFDSRISFMKPVNAETLVERTDTPFPSALIGINVPPADLHRHFGDVGSVYVRYTPEA